MSVAFDDGAVHERARVALVGVADEVLLVTLGAQRELPFLGGREAGAAASAETALLDHVADLGRSHLDDVGEGLVTAVRDVLVQVGRIDHAAALQDPALLGLEEGVFVDEGNAVPAFHFIVTVLTENLLLGSGLREEDLFHDLGDVACPHVVEGKAGLARELDVDERFGHAVANAADFRQRGIDALFGEPFLDRGHRGAGAGTHAAAASSDEDGGLTEGLTTKSREVLLAPALALSVVVAERAFRHAGKVLRARLVSAVPAFVATEVFDRLLYFLGVRHGLPPSCDNQQRAWRVCPW